MNGSHEVHTHVNGISKAGGQVETCPACGSQISRAKYEAILRIHDAREGQLAEERAALARDREAIKLERTEIAEAAAAEESAKWEVEAQRAAREIARLQQRAEADRARLARQHEKALRAEVQRRESHEQKIARKLNEMQAKVQAEVAAQERQAKREAEEKQRATVDALRAELKTVEQRRQREEDAMKRTIATLQRKAEARDRGHFGPDGEQDLLSMLHDEFPGDRIEHHGKGGDVLHYVIDGGKTVATIVYEVKNRGTWDGAFVKQTRAAMQQHGTTFGLLVTRVMPARRADMCVIGGVIVTVPAIAAQIVTVMREGIVAIARLNASERDKESKAHALVSYLRGEEFTGAMKRVAVKIGELRESLSRERSHHDGWWRTRELGYASVLREVAGIDGRVTDLLSGSPANDNHVKPVEKVR